MTVMVRLTWGLSTNEGGEDHYSNRLVAGLLAWIVEKFRSWTDCKGDVESRLSKDEMLMNVSIYWFNANITSSTRLYYESNGPRASNAFMPSGPITVGLQ